MSELSPALQPVVAMVGMPGSGKSEAADALRDRGWSVVRFGDVTEEAIRARGLEQTPETERIVREDIRAKEGMAAYALRCIPRIDAARKAGPVVVDGLYSWEEYIALTEHYGEAMVVAAVYAPPATRYARLGVRKIRPLTREQAFARDRAEIENINKGGPIAMADAMLLNTSTLEELRGQAEELARSLSGEIH